MTAIRCSGWEFIVMIDRNKCCISLSFALLLLVIAHPATAITVKIDYTYDTNNFFGAGNPQGVTAGTQAKAALENAATYFSTILADTFSAIQTPAPFHSSVSDGVVTWTWQETFTNPTTGGSTVINDPTVPANQFIVYAGARSLIGSTAGVGGPGGYGWSNLITGTNSFTQSDINTINSTTNSFSSAVETRGEPNGFARWGGAITFDTSSRNWFFDHTNSPTAGTTDFYSVALHELAHSLGFGETSSGDTAWEALISGNTFAGSNATIQNNGNPVPLSADLAHWANGSQSVVYGTATAQEAAMDPDLLDGTRKRFTALDAAAMKDIGWEVVQPPAPAVNGDYNNNGKVDAADYVLWRNFLTQSVTLPNDTTPGNVGAADFTVWRSNFGASAGAGSRALGGAAVPEPTLLSLLSIIGALATLRRRH